MKTVQFKSKDNLIITADDYSIAGAKDAILLCHRSHFNRGEYREIAPALNELGYSCLAIDQRSGMNVLGVVNETYTLAKKKKLPTGYLEARPDIEAAIDYLYAKNGEKAIIAFGSSYSASLLLLIVKNNPKVKALIAFSPGEYLKKMELGKELAGFATPLFVTSAKKEIKDTNALIKLIDKNYVTQFKPRIEGQHGARALWQKSEGHEAYWSALKDFLSAIK